MDNIIKVYVAVTVSFNDDGTMMPLDLKWEDGRRFEIDKVLDIRHAAAMKAGSTGDRYTIKVNGRQSFLFFERNASISGNNIGRWFVEKK